MQRLTSIGLAGVIAFTVAPVAADLTPGEAPAELPAEAAAPVEAPSELPAVTEPEDDDAVELKKDKKAGCNTAASVTEDVWKYAKPIINQVIGNTSPQGATVAQIARATDMGIKAWNKLAGNSWAKIGPRRLDFQKTHNGNLVGPTTRLFVSPMIAFGPTDVRIKKLSGKNKVRVVVCSIQKGKKPKIEADFTWDKNTKDGRVRTVSLPNAAGKILKVVFHGKKIGTVGMKYEVKATDKAR